MKRQFFDEGKLTQTGRLGVILIVGVLCILAGMVLLNIIDDHAANKKKKVVSSFLCKIFIGQFFEERQVLTHFSYRA